MCAFLRPCTALSASVAPTARRCTRRQALLYVLAAPALGACSMARPAQARGLRPGEAVKSLPASYPQQFPYVDEDFRRYDPRPDTFFYAYPRFVQHIDDGCVTALREYCQTHIKAGERVLDLCASVVNYFPPGVVASGLGMNDAELRENKALTDFRVLDLNRGDGVFPYEDSTFDHVLCALSLDYLIRPVEALKQCARVLKPRGVMHVAFSDRMFADKAIALWTRSGDDEHIYAVGCFMHFSGAYEAPSVVDISPRGRFGGLLGDPLYVVSATKLA